MFISSSMEIRLLLLKLLVVTGTWAQYCNRIFPYKIRKLLYKFNISYTLFTIGILGFDSWRGLGNFLVTTVSRTALGATQPPIQWVPRALSLGVKRPGREADHSPLSSTEIKNSWSYTSTSPARLHGVVLS
jgi:hypothetical protein